MIDPRNCPEDVMQSHSSILIHHYLLGLKMHMERAKEIMYAFCMIILLKQYYPTIARQGS